MAVAKASSSLRAPLGAGLAVVGALSATACGEDPVRKSVKIDWDLSRAHTRAQVDWPADQREKFRAFIEPVGAVRILLPEGKVLEARGLTAQVGLSRIYDGPYAPRRPENEVLDKLLVTTKGLTPAHRARRELAYVLHFHLRKTRSPTSDFRGRLGGKGGPVIEIQPTLSYDKARPSAFRVLVSWPRRNARRNGSSGDNEDGGRAEAPLPGVGALAAHSEADRPPARRPASLGALSG